MIRPTGFRVGRAGLPRNRFVPQILKGARTETLGNAARHSRAGRFSLGFVALLLLAMVASGALPAQPVTAAAPASTQTLKVIDLGTNATSGWYAVNDGGEVAGDVVTGTGRGSHIYAASWKNGIVKTVGTPNGLARGIDDAGDLFGVHQGTNANPGNSPTRWTASGAQYIDTSRAVGFDSINGGFEDASSNGTALGAAVCQHEFCGFVASPPKYAGTDVPGLSFTGGVNNLGHVAASEEPAANPPIVGFYNGRSVVGTGLSAVFSARSLNNLDQIVGWERATISGSPVYLPALWAAGKTTRLPDLSTADPSRGLVTTPWAINDSDVAVGYSYDATGSQAAVIWQNGKIKMLNSMLPKGSPWNLNEASDISNTGYILGTGTINGVSHQFLAQLPGAYEVSGTVYADHCGETTCARSRLPGVTILFQGKADDGAKVSKSMVTDSSGNWSFKVKDGAYIAGPSVDGTTFAGPRFDPEQWPVTVSSADIKNRNFEVCAAGNNSSQAPPSHRSRPASAGTPEVNLCVSTYTLNLSASIHQPILVDPSTYARYNENDNPNKPDYRGSTGFLDYILHSGPARTALGSAKQYPECMSDGLEAYLAKTDTKVDWYSYIVGGTSIGNVSIPMTYNQDIPRVHMLSQGPTLTLGTLEKDFKYQYTDYYTGKVVHGSCPSSTDEKVHVPMIVWPVVGPQGGSTKDATQFTILASWAFPFDAPGVRFSAENGVSATVLHEFGYMGKELLKDYDSLSPTQKFFFDSLLGAAIGEGYVKVVAGVTTRLARLSEGAAYLEKFGGLSAKYFHYAKTAQELAGFIAGYSGEYPVMGAVIRGEFTSKCDKQQGPRTCDKSALAITVKTTQFPNISLTIKRQAYPASYQDTVYTNKLLPWQRHFTGNPVSYNPFAHNPPYLIVRNYHIYDSGKTAIDELKADTEQTPAIGESMAKYGELASNFTAEQKLAAQPGCTFGGDPIGNEASTLCWVFDDGRP